MSLAKKTGVYISAINQPIIEKVMSDFGYTKISNALNFIISEYSRLTKDQPQPTEVEVVEEVKKATSLSDWFIAEDK